MVGRRGDSSSLSCPGAVGSGINGRSFTENDPTSSNEHLDAAYREMQKFEDASLIERSLT